MNNQIVLRSSSAARRIACPGSFKLERQYPQSEDSEHAIEGTLAHECVEEIFKTGFLPYDAYSKEYSGEMIQGAELLLDTVLTIRRNSANAKCMSEIFIEQKISITNIHPLCEGTPDCWFVIDNRLYIVDYKFGHKSVDVYENPQLLEYAAGAILSWGSELTNPQIENVQLIIVQPRDFQSREKVKRWELTRAQAEEYFTSLVIAEALAMQDDAPLRVNPLCSNCSARHACPALQLSALEKVESVMANVTYDLNAEETANELRYLMYAAKILDARITGLSEVALSYLKNGTRIPHFILESPESRESWTIPVDKVLEVGELYGADLSKLGVITPRQAIYSGVPENIVKSISERRSGKPRLTLDDGKKARRAFNK